MFSINYIKIYDDCDDPLRKNVKPGLFFFNDRYKENGARIEKNDQSVANRLPDFWDKNINIQAIVGQNGSGKSTILDLMYMAINNFSYLFDRGNLRPGASPLFYVKKLHVDLGFSIDFDVNNNLVEKSAVLACDGDSVKLTINGVVYKKFVIDKITRNIDVKENEQKGLSDEDIKELVTNFFYTIVSNYSMQSFISSNYRRDSYFHYYEGGGQNYIQSDNNASKECWINPIFHKNDGYIRSIVLNPYRDGGEIDLENEMSLSKDRLCALLIYGKKRGTTIFDPYTFNSLKVTKNEKVKEELDKFIEKNFQNISNMENVLNEITKWDKTLEINVSEILNRLKRFKKFIDHDIESFKDYVKSPANIILNKIVRKFKLSLRSRLEKEAALYILFKILRIIEVYPSYRKYLYSFAFSRKKRIFEILDKNLFEELLNEIEKDKSHITRKIRRTINFVKKDKCLLPDICDFDLFNNKVESDSVEEINDHLPPPFYDYELYVDKKNVSEEPISYGQLSSGEIQLLQTLSIHAYHIGNLLNVSDNRPKYKNINLVFDELEVCLHPEYQRQFIRRLVDMLNDLQNGSVHFNVMIVTHSPFILSDIPLKQILFLENGTPIEKKMKTFGGNVGDMLYDSFFMKSTVGDFAESKLKRLLKIRKKESPTENEKKEVEVIYSCIGDPIVSCLLEE